MSKNPPKANAQKRQSERWYCAACGALSSIGDKPVRKPCKCAQRGD